MGAEQRRPTLGLVAVAVVSICVILFFEVVVEQQLLRPDRESPPPAHPETIAALLRIEEALARLDGRITAADAKAGAAQAQHASHLGTIEAHVLAIRQEQAVAAAPKAAAAQQPPPPPRSPTVDAPVRQSCKPPPAAGVSALAAPTMSTEPRVRGASRFTQCADSAALEKLSYDAAWKGSGVEGQQSPVFAYPVVPTVLELQPGACDVFSASKSFCCDFMAGKSEHVPIDAPIVSTVLAFLSSCTGTCVALDVGANMGTMTKYMLSTGARVIAVEPQTDLATLAWHTACRNGWGEQLRMYNNAVTSDPSEGGSSTTFGFRKGLKGKWAGGTADEWGFRPDGGHRKNTATTFVAKKIFVGEVIAGVRAFSLVKIDTDSVDDSILRAFIGLIKAGNVTVDTFTVEEPSPDACWQMQTQLGAKNVFCAIFTSKRSISQDRLGTIIGEVERGAFCRLFCVHHGE
eukprot:COSAG06_NODE_5266_length_3599_cov_2.286000_1_plen_460_part_00